MRKGLLPCCAFGAKLGASVGPVPVPFFRLSNRAPPRAVSQRPRGGGGARATGPDGVHAGAWRDPAAPLHDGRLLDVAGRRVGTVLRRARRGVLVRRHERAPHAGRRNVPRLRVRSARRAHGVAHVRGRPRGWSAVGTVPVALGLWLGPLPLKRTDRVPRDGCAALQRCPFDVVECGRDRRERDRPGGARPDEPCRTMAGAWLGATLASQWHERTRTGRGRPRICPHGSARAVPDGINATARRTLRYTRMMPRRA
jgi:hypothetical protein